MIKKIFTLLFFLLYIFDVKAEVVENIVIEGNKRISDETIKIYGEVELNKNFTESDLNKVLSNLNSTNFFQNIEINLNIKEFFNVKKNRKIENLFFKKANVKNFPVIKLKNRLNEYHSTPIIINAANEILVELFLNKKIPFLSISKTIMKILNDRNYKKYAIRNPKNIHEITNIDKWARDNIKKILNLDD